MDKAFERPYRPLNVDNSWIESFPLKAMARQLMDEDAFAESGRNALTLVRGNEMTVVLTVIRAGTALHEHRARSRGPGDRDSAEREHPDVGRS